jgi:alcohol dehydrogenase
MLMKAAIFEAFGSPLKVTELPDPKPEPDGAVIRVQASGICRSDWHAWQGHDADIQDLPPVPGHELAGVIEAVGSDVKHWQPGTRVTLPFVCGCGTCPECLSGNAQVCDNQCQPGFTHWGSFAEYVAIRYADVNLVALPPDMDFVTAASLGCRFSTAYRAIVAQGQVAPGQWVAVHGCGGLGLSAIMIAHALGAQVIGVDIDDAVLARARALGAEVTLNAKQETDVVTAIREVSGRGAHVSLDALGSAATCCHSLECLRKRGRHVQVGLLLGPDFQPRIPLEQVIAKELQIYGSHGMQAARYSELLDMVVTGKLNPKQVIGQTISLEQAPQALDQMGQFGTTGITVIDRF